MKFCEQCGKELNEETRFCEYCGKDSQAMSCTFDWQKYKKHLIIGGAMIFLLILIFGWKSFKTDNSHQTIAISISAYELRDGYLKDRKAMAYQNKTIELSGKIIRKDQFSNGTSLYLCLYEDFESDVLVEIPISQKEIVNNMKIGDFVQIEGILIGIVPQEKKNITSIQVKALKIN